jgi:hypothetical protein
LPAGPDGLHPGRVPPHRQRPELSALYQESPSETTPWLLELARQQAARRRPADLVAQIERDRFVQPSLLDLRLVHELDGLALGAASRFEAVLLSPVAPLGSCSGCARSTYYDGVRVMFGALGKSGEQVPIGNVGVVDWLSRLTANRRHRFVAGGFGLQLLPIAFR